MTPAHWLGVLAAIAIPLLVRHVRSSNAAAEDERMSAGWLRGKR